MPVTTICVRPVSGDDVFEDARGEEDDYSHVNHLAEMVYCPSLRRRCGLPNVLSDLTDRQMARLQALYDSLEQVDENEMHPEDCIDRSILKSARYRGRRNAVDLSNQLQQTSLQGSQPTVRIVDGEVCGGLRNIHKKPLQGNWVCG